MCWIPFRSPHFPPQMLDFLGLSIAEVVGVRGKMETFGDLREFLFDSPHKKLKKMCN